MANNETFLKLIFLNIMPWNLIESDLKSIFIIISFFCLLSLFFYAAP